MVSGRLQHRAVALAFEPAEENRHGSGVVAERMAGAADDAEIGRTVGIRQHHESNTGTSSSSLPCTRSNGRGASSATASTAFSEAISAAHSSKDSG